SLATCRVDTFAAEHPTYDGRGVVVAVLDSGVEINAPGLQTLPDGSRKVIDVQDFTGEGDLFYVRTEPGPSEGEAILRDEQDRPVVVRLPAFAQGQETFYTWFQEEQFENSDIADFDDDGRVATTIPILIAQEAIGGLPQFVALFDRNQNRDFGDETALADYRLRQDHLLLDRPKPEAQRPQISIAVNLFPAERRLSLHFDDGGHGTHVAGIAAGYRLGGQPTFMGVAPGAHVISCKIGNNQLSGGSTTPGSKLEAFRYAARYAREHDVPVVINLSYGIGSEREGASSIDRGLEQVLRENPLLTVCTSAGNSGPGLSTVGTPAAAPSAIAVGALLPAETARDGRGMLLPGDAVAIFSSRGGEVLKPDIATPGYATSSVPLWNRGGDLWQGTSMASPYAAGLCARLISGVLQER
ncbi:MAG TPA: S8 family serine peptidase, partial [bacterium]|nr:S8 family serine peptidase [bacterium]